MVTQKSDNQNFHTLLERRWQAWKVLKNWPCISYKVKENYALKTASSTPHKETESKPSMLM